MFVVSIDSQTKENADNLVIESSEIAHDNNDVCLVRMIMVSTSMVPFVEVETV